MTTQDEANGPEVEVVSVHTSHEDDGSCSLHDTDEESGDEVQVHDLFDLDEKAAEEVGAHLDGSMKDGPQLG